MREDELKQLKEQRQQLLVELRSFNDAMEERARENEGEQVAEDREEYEKREKEIIALNHRLETQSRTEALVSFDPQAKADWLPQDGKAQTLAEYRSSQSAMRVIEQPDVRQAVYSWIVKGREGIDLEEYRVLSKAASGGGYLVPIDLANEIVRALRFLPGGVGSLGRTLTTSTGDVFNVPLNLTHGTAAWIAESGAYSPSDETMTQGVLAAYKAGTKVIVSEELMTDSAFDLSGFLSNEFGERIGLLAETAYISGDGSGKPTGILNGATVTRSVLPAGQVTTTTIQAIMAAVYTVPAQYRGNMSLLVSDGLWVTAGNAAGLDRPSDLVGLDCGWASGPPAGHPRLRTSDARGDRCQLGVGHHGRLQQGLLDQASGRDLHAAPERAALRLRADRLPGLSAARWKHRAPRRTPRAQVRGDVNGRHRSSGPRPGGAVRYDGDSVRSGQRLLLGFHQSRRAEPRSAAGLHERSAGPDRTFAGRRGRGGATGRGGMNGR